MSLYLWIDLLSLSVPLLVSFHPRLELYKQWKFLFQAIAITMLPFIVWDVYFTIQEYWGFNPEYLSGIYALHLPVEEWLFFICIPYACVFTHLSLLELNPNIRLSDRVTKKITYLLAIIFTGILLFNFNRAYTAVDMIFALIVLFIAHRIRPKLLNSFYLTFLVMLIPFFIVNGILTGTGIEGNIVWYNDKENLGVRMGTIPVEDSAYAFSMILMNLLIFLQFRDRAKNKLIKD
ncbi:lycopene cyclase domain-containing protein [Lutimonas saemankumensis]|uniref:lycopene cyclase domain-containing protein n=1 Tax=Lutimonas saemankumensis TaxID=483016 RepID=UPI001CD4C149|nr:lycopene cyclase domain-containing protein [Lutimonas saemankumensis]MCA0933803.1 lycopene cyclase domain-containing protein [Lutimonas saemankumensis]